MMAESLRDFRQRTAFVWDSLPKEGDFATNPRLTEKVDEAGSFRPFFGDTVIFDLPEDDKVWLGGIQRMLYETCGGLLADALNPASFHITLHDLNSAVNPEAIAPAMTRASAACKSLLAALPKDQAILVKSTAVFSMVHTSVVMGFEPVDEENCTALTALYDLFQQVMPLSYPLTPHVTLAYYRPLSAGEDTLRQLRAALEAVNRKAQRRTVRLSMPRYATFTDMNHYRSEDVSM